LSSRGLGRRPLTAETRVRIPVAVLQSPRCSFSLFCPQGRGAGIGAGAATARRGVADSVCAVSTGREGERTGGALLAEVPEAEAIVPIADIYDDIRRVFGVTFVVFVYRALAVDAARLAAAWEAVRPNLLSEETHRLARRLGVVQAREVQSLPEDVLSQSRLDR